MPRFVIEFTEDQIEYIRQIAIKYGEANNHNMDDIKDWVEIDEENANASAIAAVFEQWIEEADDYWDGSRIIWEVYPYDKWAKEP